uniref:Uncharacterized protein n=1 Tax=Chromera velia CCMP2878 TaxID=1169474 RepID=A0A0K6S7T9_9ALVE|eukprot:Cvel_5096.t1-p1 / transcript=Cvel_5096.t1 / gene=Cvel_5096 / organism=Chromera_velia_CCMP2878 / gene_product=hypothetical protein / transcript_product=hypothetical protein / location=Cvel_scaffold233:15784-19650(+) / protein_length=303 / sequence_SO=supercontig / SO=protein_coding / is_pseudo=false
MDFQAVGVNRAVGRAERCFAPAFGNPSHRSSPRSPCTAQISALGAPTASVAFHLPDPSPPPSIPSVPSAVPMPRACLSSSPLSEGDGCLSGIDLPSPSPSESLRADVRGRDGLDESASPPPSCSSESNKEGPLPSVSSGSSKSRRGRSGKGDERDKDSEGEKWNGQEGEEEQSQPTDDVERKTETAKTDQDALGRVEEGQEIKSRKRGGYRHNRSCPERYMVGLHERGFAVVPPTTDSPRPHAEHNRDPEISKGLRSSFLSIAVRVDSSEETIKSLLEAGPGSEREELVMAGDLPFLCKSPTA